MTIGKLKHPSYVYGNGAVIGFWDYFDLSQRSSESLSQEAFEEYGAPNGRNNQPKHECYGPTLHGTTTTTITNTKSAWRKALVHDPIDYGVTH